MWKYVKLGHYNYVAEWAQRYLRDPSDPTKSLELLEWQKAILGCRNSYKMIVHGVQGGP
jgi:hypothetical protein